VGAEA